MSKESAFFAVYLPLDRVASEAGRLWRALGGGSYFDDDPGREAGPDEVRLEAGLLKGAMNHPRIRDLAPPFLESLEKHLVLAEKSLEFRDLQYRSDVERAVSCAVGLVEDYIERLLTVVFGEWGAYFFRECEDRLPRADFDPNGHDPAILKSLLENENGNALSIIDNLPESTKPQWNKSLGRLLLGPVTIKRVRGRTVAKNVCLVLDAFQELGWPLRIDDPLHGGRDQARLHETIRSLNDRLIGIRFRADGTGEGFVWERTQSASP